MTGMDHAAAHERIEDLLLEPTRLAALAASTAPSDVALQAHLAGCPTCRADLEGWERVQRHLTDALPDAPREAAAAVDPIELPPSLRARVLTAARATDRSPGPFVMARARSRRAVATWVGLAASIIVLTGAGVITVDQVARRVTAESEANALSSALAAVDRVLEAPGHRVVTLENAAGDPSGSISWSSHDLVVLSTALAPPAADHRYRCWLEEGGSNVPVGWMYMAGRTAYWVGSLDEWATFQIGPTTRFVVTLEVAGTKERTGIALLSADLGT